MSGCPGVHCPGCGKGGGALAVVAGLVAGGILVWPKVVAAGHAAEHGTDVLRHDAWEAIEWTAAIVGIAVALAIAGCVLYVASGYVRSRTARREAEGATALTSCTIQPALAGQQRLALAAAALPALPRAIAARLSHEGAPAGRADDEALIPKRGQHLAGSRLGHAELLMDGDDARDHRAGR